MGFDSSVLKTAGAAALLVLGALAAPRPAEAFTSLKPFPYAARQQALHRSMPNPEAPALGSFLSGAPAGTHLAAESWPRRVRVGVVRVEFQPDDNPKTTGNGTWGDIPFFTFYDTPDSSYVAVDPTVDSRSKEYIRRNVLHVAQYYEKASLGRVLFEVPAEADISSIHRLEHELAEYGQDDDYSLRTSRLAAEAIAAADAELDFSRYDVIFVFHAGCGQHTDFVPDSPDDLHPVTINRALLREILGEGDPAYQGIPTNDRHPDGSQFHAGDIMIFPETAVQDWDQPGNFPQGALQGILGPMVHELGHYFGLPDLYDTFVATRPTVGFYALMGTGFYNSVSRIPCYPEAWSRVYLGWEEPLTVRADRLDLPLLAAALRGEGPRVLKVPISSTEYFLIENRLRDENFDNKFNYLESGGNSFPDVMTDDYRNPDGSLAEFDWSLPNVLGDGLPEMSSADSARLGSGVLIWHIDEEVIRESFRRDLTLNFVNTEPQQLGVDLEEADGLPHLIEPYPASLDPGFGSPFDAFGGAVPAVKSAELGNLNLSFGPLTDPNSDSYTGLHSNLQISGFRSLTVQPGEPVVDSLVAVDVRFEALADGEHLSHPLEGWPLDLGEISGASSPLALDLDPARPGADLVQLTADGRLFRASHELGAVPLAAAMDSVHGSPAAGDLNGDGLPELVVAAANGDVMAWTAGASGITPLPGFPVRLAGTFTATPSLAELDGLPGLEIVIPGRAGKTGSRLYVIRGDGSLLAGFPVELDDEAAAGAAVLYRDSGPAQALFVGTISGSLYGFAADGERLFRRELGAPVLCAPVVGRFGLPGQDEDFRVCAFTAAGEIWCLDLAGNPLSGWPVRTTGRCLSGGALGDVDGDGLSELVVPVDNADSLQVGQHRLYVLKHNAWSPPGYPLELAAARAFGGPAFLGAPSLADLDGDGAQEMILATRGRLGLVFRGDGSPRPVQRFILGSNAVAAPLPVDLDGDGRLELAFADGEGFLYAYRTGSAGGEAQWAGLGAGPSRTSLSSRLQQHPGPAQGEALLPGEQLYVYPNPLDQPPWRARIVYRLGREDVERVSVEIFTVSGQPVVRLEGGTAAAAGLSNEVVWEADRIASGVYLVVVRAFSRGGGEARLLRKLAIVK